MLEAQQRQLHQKVAQWYDYVHTADLAPHYPLLAHHWAHAGDNVKALDYFEKAGEQALRNHANEEAIGFFHAALRIADELPAGQAPVSGARRAGWERQLGEAYYALGNMGRSLGHFRSGLALLGLPVPASGWRVALQTARE